MSKLIILDPGHGGSDPGAVGNGLKEKDINLVISLATRDALKDYDGVTVKMTRTKDVYVSLAARAAMGKGAALFVSQHNNAFNSTAARGFETFCYNGALVGATLKYRDAIHAALLPYIKSLGVPDRGKKRYNHYITRVPPCSVTLVEYMFVTNPTDAALLKKAAVQKELGRLTAVGIAKALGLKKKAVAPKPKPAPAPAKPGTKLPTVAREIAVQVDGKKTKESGYLIDQATYVRAAYLIGLTGGTVTGHGDHIKITLPTTPDQTEMEELRAKLKKSESDISALQAALAAERKKIEDAKQRLESAKRALD